MVVEGLLADVAGKPVRIVESERLGGDFAPVQRLVLASDYPVLGRSVIVKGRRRDGEGWGFDPGNLRREYAGLQTLTDLDLGLSPRVIAGSDAADMLVLSDLGAGPAVVDLIHGDDPVAAEHGLLEMARSIGRMHVAAVGAEEVFNSHYSLFAAGEMPSARPIWEQDDPLASWDRMVEDFEALGLPSPRGACADVNGWGGALSNGRFRTLIHADLNPQNAVLVDGQVAFVDFEGAGYRHVGIDAEILRFPFQNYALRVPARIRADMERLYRGELAGSPWSDDADFAVLMAAGAVLMAITVCRGIQKVADPEQSAPSARRRRVRLSGVVEMTVDALTDADEYPQLRSWFVDLLDAMRERWSEVSAAPEFFPAFS